MKELFLQNTRLDGRYDVLKLLGRGSYAEIFVARDALADDDSRHKTVVVKALNVLLQDEPDEDLERTLIENFQNEAVALDRVRHPHIISRLGHGTARDLDNTIFHYLVLEYLPGGDLAEKCKRGRLTFEQTLFYLDQVCRGLTFAHSKGVIHRDIKPNNLLLSADQQICKIADFGVAKFGDLSSPITRVGTNVYAAPEHSPLNVAAEIAGGATFALTPAADVYSLAKTVYALLTGESPRRFANASITNFPASVAAEAWANSVLPVLEKATQTNAAARTKTVEDFWRELCEANEKCADRTKIAGRPAQNAAATVSAGSKTAQPTRPAFDSQPNVQIAPPELQALPERPRVVVEFKPPSLKQPSVLNPNRAANAAARATRDFAATNDLAARGGANVVPPKPRAEAEPPRSKFEALLAGRAKTTLERASVGLAVVLIIVGSFAALLAGTYSYLQNEGYLPAWTTSDPAVGREAIINATVVNNSPVANLRAEAGIASRDIGDVANGSRVKILKADGNWYEIRILERSIPKQTSEPDRGWINKKLVEIQQ